MKYFKRSNMYKASNVTFCLGTCRAYSYDWWRFVDVIDGLVIFNDYNYSPTTIKHQYKVKRLMSDLGINIDRVIHAPKGLQDLNSARKYAQNHIIELTALINKPRTRKTINDRRRQEIIKWKRDILTIDRLISSQQR